MRKVFEITDKNVTVKVHYASAWNEFRVRLYVNGKVVEEADAFSDYKCDAISTAKVMCEEESAYQRWELAYA